MAKLVTQQGGWAYQPDKCPADRDFIKYMESNDIRRKTVFAMGPGDHHLVGRMLLNNRVLSITCSVEEMDAYMDMAIDDPFMARHYQCMFGDIYLLNERLIPPDLDVVYLPHLGEMPNNARNDYQAMSDTEVLNLLIESMSYPGYLVAYHESSAWDRMEQVFKDAAINNSLRFLHKYKSLSIWVRPV
jgi:hypothetical protein